MKAALPPGWRDGLTVSSAGTHAWEGQPASSLAVTAMKEMWIDISGHRARRVSDDIINRASLVVALDSSHMEFMKAAVPGAGEWMILLGELDGERQAPDVEDPIGGSLEDYRTARDDISALISLLLMHLVERFGLPEEDFPG